MTEQPEKKQVFRNRVINKKQLNNLVSWAFTNYGTARTAQMADAVKEMGFRYATRAGVSISVDDLQIPPTKKAMLEAAEETIRDTEEKYTRGEITEVERFQKVIDTWNATSENLKDEVVRHFKANDPLNSVYMMAFSGARGNVSQVRQLVGMRGLMANPQGEIIDLPIKTNFREGLTVTEYIISSYGARKGLVDTALRTADSGYLTRRLVDVSQDVIIREIDCGTQRGVEVTDMTDGDRVLIHLADRLLGRVTNEPVLHPETGAVLAERNQDISSELAEVFRQAKVKKVMVRSPLTCEATRSVCQLCYGWSLAHAHLVDIGEAVGIIAAQSIGEPGTQLTMRTFHTGGVFTGEVARQEKANFAGTVRFNKKMRTRAFRTSHGQDALVVESIDSSNKVTVEGTKDQNFTLPQGAMMFVTDGQTVEKGQILAEIPLTGRSRKTTEKAAKDVATDLAGEVRFADVVPEEKKDRQGNTTRIAQRGGLIWVLSGEVYNLPPAAEPSVKNGDQVKAEGVIAETKLTTENGGVVRLAEVNTDSKGGREVEIITASVMLDKAQVRKVESLQGGGDQYRLEAASGQVFSLKATPGTQVGNGQVVAELIDDRYHTQTGGIIKFAGIELTKRGKAKQGYEVVKGGTIIWIPEEAHEVNKDISLLMVEDGQFVEAGTEVVKDIFCQTNGVVEVTQKNDILREIVVKPGDLHMVDSLEGLVTREAALVQPGQAIMPKMKAKELCYAEFVETPEGPGMLVRPVVEYEVPDEPSVPSQESSSEKEGRNIRLRAVQRISYKDGERVKSVEGIDLVRTQLVLDSDQENLSANIELIADAKKADIMRLQLVILESLVVRRDIAADTTQGSTRTEILVKDGDRIAPGAVIARTSILCKEDGEVQGIREGMEAIRRILVVRQADQVVLPTSGKAKVKVGDLMVAGSSLEDGNNLEESGEVLAVDSKSVTMRIARPYRVSPGAVLHVDNGDLVQRGDNLVLLIFERTKTGDIIQGLPRIEEVLEARKPKEACVLGQRTGTVQVAYAEDDSVEVKVVDDEGLLTDYPIGPGQSVIVADGERVASGERLTDGPVNPHDLLEILFQANLEKLGTHEAALVSLREVQTVLVGEVQAVYQSQGIDISDKHIEVVVRQMTSKVRVEDGGDTTMLPGELVELYQIEQVNEAMAITGGAPAHYTPVLLGITKASLNTDSFISAASFQETTRVLTEAAIEGKSDWLRGLKENVIIGRLIPAGTGFNAYEEVGAPDIDISYDSMFDDDADLADIVLDDRTARNYNLDGLDDRPTFSFESFGAGDSADYGATYKSPILDDDDELIDDSVGNSTSSKSDDEDDDEDDDMLDDDDL